MNLWINLFLIHFNICYSRVCSEYISNRTIKRFSLSLHLYQFWMLSVNYINTHAQITNYKYIYIFGLKQYFNFVCLLGFEKSQKHGKFVCYSNLLLIHNLAFSLSWNEQIILNVIALNNLKRNMYCIPLFLQNIFFYIVYLIHHISMHWFATNLWTVFPDLYSTL